MAQPTCEERIEENLENRIKDLERMFYSDDESEREAFHDYGLSFDYVAPNTFTDQKQGFFRYQLSCGGPSDEIRIYTNPDFTPHCIEYVFQDWFDGATLVCNEIDHLVVWDICTGIFTECGYFESSFNKSMKDCLANH